MRDEPNGRLKRRMHDNAYHKGCCPIKTAGRWPWKSESAKECVTTHLPNGVAPKMDGSHV